MILKENWKLIRNIEKIPSSWNTLYIPDTCLIQFLFFWHISGSSVLACYRETSASQDSGIDHGAHHGQEGRVAAQIPCHDLYLVGRRRALLSIWLPESLYNLCLSHRNREPDSPLIWDSMIWKHKTNSSLSRGY